MALHPVNPIAAVNPNAPTPAHLLNHTRLSCINALRSAHRALSLPVFSQKPALAVRLFRDARSHKAKAALKWFDKACFCLD